MAGFLYPDESFIDKGGIEFSGSPKTSSLRPR